MRVLHKTLLPKVFETTGRQFCIAHRRLDRAVAEISLQSPGVGALVRQHIPRCVTQHMWMHLEGHLGLDTGALNHLLQAGDRERRAPLADEDEGRLGLALERPQRPQFVA